MLNPIKKTIAFCLGCLLALSTEAQKVDSTAKARAEKSAFGIQVGFMGTWVHHEWGLTPKIILRSELGLHVTEGNSSPGSDVMGFVLTPTISVEPRWYYNLTKRMKRSKDITGNSGNFLSARVVYWPNWFRGNYLFDYLTHIIAVLPAWGMRRNISRHFNYEAGIGLGQLYTINISSSAPLLYPHIYARIGYRFSKGTRRKKEK